MDGYRQALLGVLRARRRQLAFRTLETEIEPMFWQLHFGTWEFALTGSSAHIVHVLPRLARCGAAAAVLMEGRSGGR